MRTPETSSAKAEASAEPAQEPAAPAPAHEQRSVTPILVGVGLVAVLGLGVVLTRKSEPTSVPLGGTTTAISAEIKTTAAPEPKASAPAEPASAAPAPAESGVVDINALGAEPSAKAAPRASGPLHKPGDPPDGPVAPATAPPTAEPPASAAPRPMGSVGDLKDEMRKRVGATDQPSDQPDDSGPAKNPNAKQEKPSNAAVLGALGAVRGAVKSCISDLDKPVRISVTFQSDGSVRSVTVSGAGKAESCVQAAVKKARVAPFMNDSFSTSFSVSP